jgi:hypothetical protein
MSLTQKQLLYQMAEETAWSFKGHMKTADGYGFTLACLIVVPLITSLLVLIFDLPLFVQRIASALGFLFSSHALTSTLATNKEKADKTISAHMELGNKYLNLYNEIKIIATDTSTLDQAKLSELKKKLNELNMQTNNLRITLIGRWWCKLKINKEMDLAWIKSN